MSYHDDTAALETLADDAAYERPRYTIRDAYDAAEAIASDPDELDRLQARALLDYGRVSVKIDGEFCDLFRSADCLRLRVNAGKHDEAACIARDMTDALISAIADLALTGKL